MALPRAWMRVASLAALAVLLFCANAQAKYGDLWITDPQPECSSADTGYVYSVNPTTHVVSLLTAGGALRKPLDVAASPDGKTVWVADAQAFDTSLPHSGCDTGNGGVIAIDTTTGAQTVVSNTSNPGTTWVDPSSIAYDGVNNRLIVLDKGGTAKIYAVDLATHSQTTLISSGLPAPQSVVVRDGVVYVLDDVANSGPEIFKVSEQNIPPTLTPVSIDSKMGLSRDMAFASNGDLIVFDEQVGGTTHPGVLRINTTSGIATELGPTTTMAPSEICAPGDPLPSYTHPVSLAADPTGTHFYGFDAGPVNPMWCGTPASGIPPTDGLMFSIDGTNGAGTWVAGGKTPRPWAAAPAGMTAAYNRAPKAAAAAVTAQVGDPVTIDASSSMDPDGDALSYRFDLNDDKVLETSSTSPTVTTSFAAEGDHVVGVEVSDSFGGVSVTTTVVHVLAKPVVQDTTTTTTETTTTETTVPPVNPPVVTPPVDQTTPQVPAQVTLGQLISKGGVTVPLICTTDCSVSGTLTMFAKDFRNLTAAERKIVLGTGSLVLKAGKHGNLRIRLTKKAKKQLKIALGKASAAARRKIRLNLTLTSKYKSGKKKTIRRKIILKG